VTATVRMIQVGLAAACAFIAAAAQAQTYPDHPITMVLPYPPGASTEQLARAVQNPLQTALGQPVIVENRPGAAGNIGSAYVAKSPPDGYRLLLTTNAVLTLNPHFYPDLGFDPLKDIAPVTRAVNGALAIAVHTSLPVNTLPELIAYAKAHPKEIFYGTTGTGSPQHMMGETLNRLAGIELTHVPYKGGGPAMNDLLGGHIKMVIITLSTVLPQVGSGRIKILAIGESKRFSGAPDIPTVAETLPGFDVTSWLCFVFPGSTPKPLVDRMNGEMVKALNLPEVKEKLETLALPVVADKPEDLAQTIRSDFDRWGKVIRELGIKPDQ
jgi:tripartite-type tricarboxylate transporter receptor subunit TctC